MSFPDKENQQIYQEERVVRQYAQQKPLFPAEERVLRELTDTLRGRRILDLGVGGGRTTPHLLAISQNYVGLDYSLGMIEQCQQQFPGIEFVVADVRKLEQSVKKPFAFILFSYNGIDYILPEERHEVLCAIYRLLEPGGWFFFSTHNRRCTIRPAWHWDHLHVSWNPLRMGFNLIQWGKRIVNAWNRRALVCESAEFSWRVDTAFAFTMLTCYVNKEDQIRQLERSGFVTVRSFDMEGREHIASSGSKDEDTGPWIHYLAHKPGAEEKESC